MLSHEAIPRGVTLVELVVTLTLSGAIFGAFAMVVVQHERAQATVLYGIRARNQAREGIAPLVAELRNVSPSLGDIPPSGARDSSIELRATIGTAVACGGGETTVLTALGAFVDAPEAGDTVWAFNGAGGSGTWLPVPTTAVWSVDPVAPTPCNLPVLLSDLTGHRRASERGYGIAVAAPPAAIAPGTPLRFTRAVRYSLYRAPDTRWYIGRRSWRPASQSFETIQPVSGPFAPYHPAIGISGLTMTFVDAAGNSLPDGTPDTYRIARVEIMARTRPPPGDSTHRDRRDVTSVTVAFR